jgi:hypothetical protein
VPRAPKVCAQPGCHELTPTSHCPAHAPKPWSTGAPRIGRRGWAWTRQRNQQLEADSHACQQCGHHDPTGKTLEIDHADDSSLRTLCRTCHRRRTQAQAAQARWGGVAPPPG